MALYNDKLASYNDLFRIWNELDTDPAYFALSKKSVEKKVLNHPCVKVFKNIFLKRGQYWYNKVNDITNVGDTNAWFPRQRCVKHNKHDARTQGLMKIHE